MRVLLFVALALYCADAHTQSYKCPAENAGILLTNAQVRIGPQDAAHALHGDVNQVLDGTDIHYNLPDGVPHWLVCEYGGKRVEGSAISAPQTVAARETRIPLNTLVNACDLVIRKHVIREKGGSVWTAVATCENSKPPPPDMM